MEETILNSVDPGVNGGETEGGMVEVNQCRHQTEFVGDVAAKFSWGDGHGAHGHGCRIEFLDGRLWVRLRLCGEEGRGVLCGDHVEVRERVSFASHDGVASWSKDSDKVISKGHFALGTVKFSDREEGGSDTSGWELVARLGGVR